MKTKLLTAGAALALGSAIAGHLDKSSPWSWVIIGVAFTLQALAVFGVVKD